MYVFSLDCYYNHGRWESCCLAVEWTGSEGTSTRAYSAKAEDEQKSW